MSITVEATLPGRIQVGEKSNWGRRKNVPQYVSVGAALGVIACPAWMLINWLALEHHDGSMTMAIQSIVSHGVDKFSHIVFQPTRTATYGYAAWLVFQALLYVYLPGPECHGQQTPGGHTLAYTANGLNAWALTHVLFLAACTLGVIDPAIIAKHWEGLLVAANIYGFVLAGLMQLKAFVSPSYPRDRKASGSFAFDFWAGIELNPRIGDKFDLKFFHNGRPGIVAWTLIDLSWAAYQYQNLGHVTSSMLLVLLFHTIYVVDFFVNESWYTRTIDIAHDHFGFMLTWGDAVFLPSAYTLQAQYLARNPVYLTRLQALAILVLGLTGYAIFRSANHQKDLVRSTDGKCSIWGKPAKFLRNKYYTSDGKQHESLLLTSGWWGTARHVNYAADLLQSWAMCATCGFTHLLPWTYFFFMAVLLWHRARRDHRRCRAKYGPGWDKYCQLVRWRIIPGVY